MEAQKKNVAYVIIREELDSPLISSQVIDVIASVNEKSKNLKVFIFWLYRIDFLWRKNGYSIANFRKLLKRKNIELIALPFLALRFPLSPLALAFCIPQWMLPILILRIKWPRLILHCRSYHAGVLGCISASFFGLRYVFDPRSPFPEEKVESGRWRVESFSFCFWKKLETSIIEVSQKTILVSRELATLYNLRFPATKFTEIPNNYPHSLNSIIKERVRVHNESYSLVYIGSLGHWNRLDPYLKLISELNKRSFRPINMLFLTSSLSKQEIIDAGKVYGLHEDLIHVASAKQSEVSKWLKKCSVGVYLMENPDPRLGVKTVEYLANGLPIIVSQNIKGAARVIKFTGLGFVYRHTTDTTELLTWLDQVRSDRLYTAKKCKEYARNHFSTDAVSQALCDLYTHDISS